MISVPKKKNVKQAKEFEDTVKVPFVTFGEIAVLFNAIIIIIGIYLWIKPVVTEQGHKTLAQQSHIEQIDTRVAFDFNLVESELRQTALVLSTNLSLNSKAEYQSLISASNPITKFDQVYWIKKQDNKLRVIPLLEVGDERDYRDSYNFNINSPHKEVISSFLKPITQLDANKIHVELTPEFSSMFTKDVGPDSTVLIQPFVISQKVYGADSSFLGYIIGLTRSNKAFEVETFGTYSSLTYLTVTEQKSGVTLLAYSKQTDSLMRLFGKEIKRDKILDEWDGRNFAQQSVMIIHAGNAFLAVALNGFLVIGALYATFLFSLVRNNRIRRVRALNEKEDLIKQTITLGHDASEKQELQSRVDMVEKKNIALLNSINDIIIETDMNANVVFVNGAWNRVTGLGNVACLDQRLFDLINDEDIELHKKEFLMLVRGHKENYSFSTKLICTDHQLKDVDIVLTPVQIHDSHDDVRVVATITNMQERNQAQRALVEVEARYKSIWERAAFGLFQLAADGKYITANPAFYKILGYKTLEEMQTSVDNANKQVYVNYRERMKFLRALEQNNEIKNWETQVRRKDGVAIWINENSRLVRDDKGAPLYIEGSIEDVTERVETSSSLQQAKMDSDMANRAKSEFLANMSHELRTPLNSIIGFSEIIRDEVMGPIGQKAYWEYARDINKSGQRLLRIINEILDISRIETGERELNDSMVDLKKLSEKCLDILGNKIHNAELSLVIDIPEETPNVLGEELAIKQMMMNLLSNAIKFTPSRGKITISTEVEDKGSLRLSITDTGVGINDEDVDKALSPFTQLDGSDLGRQNSGTGLGLTLVNALIKMHNGRLELMSQKGIGTTATLIFPLDRVLPKTISHSDIQMMAKTEPVDAEQDVFASTPEAGPVEQQADVFARDVVTKSPIIEHSNVNIYAEYEKELDAREARQKAELEAAEKAEKDNAEAAEKVEKEDH